MIPRHKIYRMLRSMSVEETDEFVHFLRTDFSHVSSAGHALMECIRNYAPEYTGEVLRPSQLVREMGWQENHNAKYVADLLSLLSRDLERYLAIIHLLRDESGYALQLTQALLERDLYDLSNQYYKRKIVPVELIDEPNWEDTIFLHNYYRMAYGQPATLKGLSRSATQQLADKNMRFLDRYYLITKLAFASDLRMRETTGFETHSIEFLSQVLVWARLLAPADPIVRMFLRIYEMYEITEIDETEYVSLCDLFFSIFEELSDHDAEFCYAKLTNHGNRMIRRGKSHFQVHLFELARRADASGLFDIRPALSMSTFLNNCALGSMTGHFSWTLSYINRNQNRLPDDDRETLTRIGQAYVYLHQGDTDEVYSLIGNLYSPKEDLQLRIYSLFLRSAYEGYTTGNYKKEALWARLRTTTRYFSRNQVISRNTKRAYLNLIRAIRDLVQFRERKVLGGIGDLSALLNRIRSMKPIIAVAWIDKQLENLELDIKKPGRT